MPRDDGFNSDFTEEDLKLLAARFAPLKSPQDLFHRCFWMVDGAACNKLVLGREFSEHIHTYHVTAVSDKTLVRCFWAGCSCEMKKESLTRHIQERHLELKYTCPACSERFTRNYTRDLHVTMKHAN